MNIKLGISNGVKRSMDIVLVLLGFIVALPLMGIVALVIKINSPPRFVCVRKNR